MTPIYLVGNVIYLINGAFALTLFALSVWALIIALRASDYAYQSAFKRTKTFWVAVTGGCTLFSLFFLLGVTGFSSLFLQLIVAVAVGVFLADVRPAITVRR